MWEYFPPELLNYKYFIFYISLGFTAVRVLGLQKVM